jgi:hypothetical protein
VVCNSYSQVLVSLKANNDRDDLVDNFSKHQDEVEKILSEGVKKVNLNGR